MARINLANETDQTSYLEIRPWGLAGRPEQWFCIGPGVNFNASWTFWVEVLHVINGLRVFYIRHFITSVIEFNEHFFEPFWSGEVDRAGVSDMLPDSGIELTRRTLKGDDFTGGSSTDYKFRVWLDASILFDSLPGDDKGLHVSDLHPSTVEIVLEYLSADQLHRFTDDFTREMLHIQSGGHLDPRRFSPELSRWPLIRSLNASAYDEISRDYHEEYFANERLVAVFNNWLGPLPPSARILDIGCGHGDPVIGKLLEHGHQVTGLDTSPRMLARARQNYPGVEFIELPPMDLADDSRYDAACSFSSLLYLDPIDLRFSLNQVHKALKPGGTLFLYAFNVHPEWVGWPYSKVIKQYMWSWNHSLEDAIIALEEHGLFKVLQSCDATTPEEHEKALSYMKKDVTAPPAEPFSVELHGKKITFPGPPEPLRVPPNAYVILAEKR